MGEFLLVVVGGIFWFVGVVFLGLPGFIGLFAPSKVGANSRKMALSFLIAGVMVAGLGEWIMPNGGDDEATLAVVQRAPVSNRSGGGVEGIESAMLQAYEGVPDFLEEEILTKIVIPCLSSGVDRNYRSSLGVSRSDYAVGLMVLSQDQTEATLRATKPLVQGLDRSERESVYDLGLATCLRGMH